MDARTPRQEATRNQILGHAWGLTGEKGLTGWTLRELAEAVGMRAPSLYRYFRAKDEIFDAMFEESYRALLALMASAPVPDEPRERLRAMASGFFEFAVADPARLQLMSWRVIPGFEPSPASYAPSVQALERTAELLTGIGITDPDAVDVWSALLTGFVSQQVSNDPGGDRWRRLLDGAVDMFADAHLPA